jgi:dihydrofolate synthase/folylpolyglutamate synthase
VTYEQAIDFWFRRINYEQNTPQQGDLKLDRMRALLGRLGDPQDRLRIVHVAGSKGKGSTAAMLAAILQAAGYRTALFTSPHLVSVEERIQIDRQPIPAPELAALMDEIRRACTGPAGQNLERELTFFEIGTALGFLHFARRRADIAVIEVGLGGRFDSTNVCRPLASIITSISLDHTQLLGNTPEQIAFEKAGIIKPARATISGVRGSGPRRVIADICRQRGSAMRQVDADFGYEHEPGLVREGEQREPVVHVRTWRRAWPELHLGLIGEHQAQNAAVAVATVEVLGEMGLPVGEPAVRSGLARVDWPARMEILCRQPLAVLDCAHNTASANALVQALRESFPRPPGARRLLVFAGSRDKDLEGMLRVLALPFDRIFLTRFRDSPRATAPEELIALVPEERRAATVMIGSAAQAWSEARREAGDHDLICVAGSVFLAGELRPLMLAGRPGDNRCQKEAREPP